MWLEQHKYISMTLWLEHLRLSQKQISHIFAHMIESIPLMDKVQENSFALQKHKDALHAGMQSRAKRLW